MNGGKRGWHLSTLVAMTFVLHSSLAIAIENGTQIETQESAPWSATEEELAQQLRAAIDRRYKELAGAHALTGKHNDITNAFLPYIRTEMSFQDAERILRCAGFDIIHPDPTPPTIVNRPSDWYVVLARISPYMKPYFIGCKTDLYVSLLPHTPGEYTSVEEVRADFLVSCP